jgi:hypothetical protein
MGHRSYSGRKHDTRGNGTRDPRLRADLGLVTNLDVVDDPYLPGQDNLIPNLRTSGHSSLSCNNAILPDDDVVSNLNQVVYLRAPTNNGSPQGSSIYGRIRPDLHIVLDHHRPDLGDLDSVLSLSGIAETVRANHGTRMENHAVTDPTTLTHGNPGVKNTVLAHLDSISEKHARKKNRASTDSRFLSHIDMGINRKFLI